MQNTKKLRKIMSAIVVLSMMMAYVLPMSVAAAVPTATATASTIENGEGNARTNVIKVSFDTEITFDNTDWETNITAANGTAPKSFGTGATAVVDPTEQKDITITLGSGYTVAAGDKITFTNGIVADSTNPSEVFNGDVEVEGTFEPATINYTKNPAAADVTVTGYTSLPTTLGVGTYSYTASCTYYKDITSGSFEVTQEDLNTTKNVTITLEKDDATYTDLDLLIDDAEKYSAANYTASSFAVLTAALANANGIDRNLKADEQGIINNLITALETAINGLVAKRTVDFMAVGVADNVNISYGKAIKLVLVFAEPIDATADAVLANLSIKDKIQSAVWADSENTVLSLKLKEDANLTNSTEVTYTANDSVKTKLTPAVVDTKTVTALGNFEGAELWGVANQMTATIVKESDKPGIAAGDKIVIVFNAPVKNTPSSIIVNGMTANAVAGTNSTVYQIILSGTETVDNSTTLLYDSMTALLSGSFGSSEVPKAMKAYAVDNDGTELVENDEIIVKFNVPTNCADDISKISVKGNGYTASLGASTMRWDSTKTQLTIKLASDAVIKDGVEINLKNLGIKDTYETVDADLNSLVLNVEGSFGYTVQPRIVKAMAFSQGTYDYIRVFFNTTVKNVSLTKEEPTFNNGFEMGDGAEFGLVDNGGSTYYEIKMKKNAHSALKPGTTIALTGVADAETGNKLVSDTPYEITGAFVSPITPEIQNVVALSVDGSGVAKAGDKIAIIFNTEIVDGDVTVLNGKSFGTGYTKNVSGNVVEITLGEEPTVEIGSEIRVEGFKDKATLSVTMTSITKAIGGTFGKIIEPKIISATAISNDGSGIPKVGDKIVAVFNTKVRIDGNELFVYEYQLKDSDNLDDYLVGKTFKVMVESVATGKSKECAQTITGTYGLETMPNVKSVVLSGVGGIETITVVFDRQTKVGTALMAQTAFTNNNRHLDARKATWNTDGTVLTIELGDKATTTATVFDEETGTTVVSGDVLNLSGLGIKSVDTGKDVENIDKLAITGTLYPVITDAGVIADGQTVVIKFSARTNGDTDAAKTAVANMKVLFGTDAAVEWKNNNTELHIKMSDDNTMSDNAYIVLNSFNIFDGFSKTYKVVGQYKIDTASLTKKTLNITSVFARANNTDNAPREDASKGIKGDNIVVRFEDFTDKTAGTDAKANVEIVGEEVFGTDYTAIWNDAKTIIITLGEDTTVTTATKIKIKDVRFANNTGYLAKGDANEVEKTITGQFDGRKYWIVNPEKNSVNGRIRVVGMINKADITAPAVLNPFVVCQAYNSNGTVISINAIRIADMASSNVVFDFDAANLSKIKLFVLGGEYTDPEAAVTVYSETVEK